MLKKWRPADDDGYYFRPENARAWAQAKGEVSHDVVSKLVRQKRELGTLEPQVHKQGRKPAISGEKKAQLLQHQKDHPDATVVERIEALGLECVEKTAWQTLRGMGWRFKKILACGRAGPPRREASAAWLA